RRESRVAARLTLSAPESERRSRAHADHRLPESLHDKQADRGVSLDAQRAKVNAYAELYDLELADVIVDAGESAKSLDRPGLQRALAMLKAGEAEALLVVKLDRLTRSVCRPRQPRGALLCPRQG